MAIQRGIDGTEPLRPEPIERPAGPRERRPAERSWHLASGSLACPACDAPVAPSRHGMPPSEPVSCGFCDHSAALRDFLSLAAPPRPARVDVIVVARAR